MNVYTAEDSSGEIHLIWAERGSSRSHEHFQNMALVYCRESCDGDSAPRDLDLFDWPDETVAGRWLQGEAPTPGQRWSDMAQATKFAEVKYEYPGDWFVTTPIGASA